MLKKFLIGTFVAAAFVVAFAATPVSADCSITTTLRVGSIGAEVSCLQAKVGATADGKFGPLTKASVMAYQSNHGLSADGVVGPLSRAVLNGAVSGNFPVGCTSASGFSSVTGLACTSLVANTFAPAGCTNASGYSPVTGGACYTVSAGLPAGCSAGALFSSTTGLSCTGAVVTGPLVGSFGTISTFTQLSQYSNEEIGSGSTNVKIAGFEIKPASGDINLNAIKLMFDSTSNATGDSDRIADYLTKVSVYMGSTLVGSVSTADFAKDSTGIYSLTMPLSGAVVRKDVVTPFYISVDAVSNLDSEDINSDSWTLGIANVRYVDGSGVTTTDTSSMPVGLIYSTGGIAGTDGVGISFVTFATASGTELKISADATNPVAQVIKVSTTIDTSNVVLMKGKMKLEGTSDVWLDELPIVLTTTGSSIDAVASSVKLTIDGKEFTESLGANCVSDTDWVTTESCASHDYIISGVIFDNLDVTIKAGSTIYFTVSATINDIETGELVTSFNEGDTLLASITGPTTGARAFIVAENAQGDQLTDATEMTGTITGVAQVFRSSGISVALVSTGTQFVAGSAGSTTSTPIADSGIFTITFDVTANGSDVWIDKSNPIIAGTAVTDNDLDQTGVGDLSSSSISNIAGATAPEVAGTGYAVRDGTTQRFVISARVLATTSGDFRIAIGPDASEGIAYALTDADGTTKYTTGLTAFKTALLYLTKY